MTGSGGEGDATCSAIATVVEPALAEAKTKPRREQAATAASATMPTPAAMPTPAIGDREPDATTVASSWYHVAPPAQTPAERARAVW